MGRSVLVAGASSGIGHACAQHPIDTPRSPLLVGVGLRRRLPAPGLLHHSDRGSQYTSAQTRALLAAQGQHECCGELLRQRPDGKPQWDLVLRYGDAYEAYRKRTGLFFPKRNTAK